MPEGQSASFPRRDRLPFCCERNIRYTEYTVKRILLRESNSLHYASVTMSPLMLDVRRIRERRGMTQVQLAESAGVRQATISAMETGQTRGVDFDVLERVADVLKVEPGSLIVRQD